MNAIQINPADTVAVVLSPLDPGDVAEAGQLTVAARAAIPAGHKIALVAMQKGDAVIKYGAAIGNATAEIAAGDHVHSHNLSTGLSGALEYEYHPRLAPPAPRTPGTFRGFVRENGKVGIRNELWIIPTVGCVNGIGQSIAARAQYLAKGSVGGVYCFPHPYGCSQLGDDHENTRRVLAGIINHPNAGAVLVLGLGCENNTVSGMQALLGHADTDRVKFLTCQDVEDEEASALALLEGLAAYAGKFTREDVPMSELTVGLKCGGSDGFSGITANPLVGAFADRLIAEGGSAILTEVPEMFGAEQILMNRCADRETFGQTVRLINAFKEYFTSHGQPVYENPSPGNKAGGITTLEDKSLGCTQKAGSATVAGVLAYAQPVAKKGLHLMAGPGNDLVSATALSASGAHLVLFTTGRGTPFGAPVPTVKISSNSTLAARKTGWIDFNAGGIVTGVVTIPALADELYEYVRAVASGDRYTTTEQRGIRDFAIFKNCVTL